MDPALKTMQRIPFVNSADGFSSMCLSFFLTSILFLLSLTFVLSNFAFESLSFPFLLMLLMSLFLSFTPFRWCRWSSQSSVRFTTVSLSFLSLFVFIMSLSFRSCSSPFLSFACLFLSCCWPFPSCFCPLPRVLALSVLVLYIPVLHLLALRNVLPRGVARRVPLVYVLVVPVLDLILFLFLPHTSFLVRVLILFTDLTFVFASILSCSCSLPCHL